MNIRNIDLNLLVAFNALMKYHNVSQAAESLSITQPSMSNALKRLRTLLDDDVLVRAKKGMIPTPKALGMFEESSRILQELEALFFSEAHFDPSELESNFVISTTDDLQQVLLPILIPKIRKVAPKVKLSFVTLNREYSIEQLESGEVNFVITVNWTAPDYLKQVKLYDEGFSCLVAQDHPVLEQELDLENYLKLPHVLVAPLGYQEGVVDQILKEKNKKRSIQVILPHFMTVPFALQSSDLIVTLPTRVAQELSSSYPLTLLEPPFEIPRYNLYVIWHQRFNSDPTYSWFRNLLKGMVP